ncbi:microcephalin-like [Diadema antillarum]|uniref:microcephalin-like n=1 Tax=Diadema antillarum TaxID=105358 RepID=UPI003A898A4B
MTALSYQYQISTPTDDSAEFLKSAEDSHEALVVQRDADEAMLIDSDDDVNDMPDTQPVDDRVLKDVLAYVEVRTKAENRSKGVSKQLELLGAKVSTKFTNDVTHVIWKDGKKSTRDKATKKGINLVSVLWVDSCKQNQEHVAESLFPVNAPDEKESLPIKLKRMKSMQPKAVEEDIQKSSDRGIRKRKRRDEHPSPASISIQPRVLVADTQPMTPTTFDTPRTPSLIPETPSSMKACLDLLDSIKKNKGSAHRRLSITDSPRISPSTPLQQRLFQCFMEESNSLNPSPSTSVRLHKSGPTTRKRQAVQADSEVEDRSTGSPVASIHRGRPSGETPRSHKRGASKTRGGSEEKVDDGDAEKALKDEDSTVEEERRPEEREDLCVMKPSSLVADDDGTDRKVLVPDERDTKKGRGHKRKTSVGTPSRKSGSGTKPRGQGSRKSQKKKRDGNFGDEPPSAEQKSTTSSSAAASSDSPRNNSLAPTDGNYSKERADRQSQIAEDVPQGPASKKRKLLSSQPQMLDIDGVSLQPPEEYPLHNKEYTKEEEEGNKATSSKGGKWPCRLSGPTQAETKDENCQPASLQECKVELSSALSTDLSRSSVLSSLDNHNRPSIEEFKMTGAKKLSATKKAGRKNARQGSESSILSTSWASSNDDEQVDKRDKGDAQPEQDKAKKRKKVKIVEEGRKKKSTLVMTSLHRSDQEVLISVVNELGGFSVTDMVCETTTHVVMGENRRTLNVLSAIARGCWLVSMDWVYRSVEAGSWLPEERFEMSDHFPGAMVSRLAHEQQDASGPSDGRPTDLFSSHSALYVAPESSPPRERLTELIEVCGGHVTRRVSEASMCIGSRSKRGSTPAVSEKWILDCITRYQQLPWKLYEMK